MALTDIKVRQAKHSGKPAGDKHADGGGLYLLVKESGKYWRQDYRFAGKRKTLALGVYPTVTLAEARKARDAAKERLKKEGIDPSTAKQHEKIARTTAAANTFEAVARELHAKKDGAVSPAYRARWLRRMEKDLFPYLGRLPLSEITAPMLLLALQRVEARGTIDMAHVLRAISGEVFRYGIQTDRCERDPATALRGALKPHVVKHAPAILEPVKVGELLRAIWGYTGQPTTKAALQLSAMLFQRPGNIRAMEWTWIDLDAAMLTIPAQSMKRRVHDKINGRPHFVPLAAQAVAILKDLQPLTGHGKYVFPSIRTGEKPLSDNTLNAALRGLGFSRDEMVAHGFRSMARTLIAERLPGISVDAVEAQLAHGKSGPLGAAYDRAEFMEQRRRMMSEWGSYLDRLRAGGAKVIPMRRAA